MLALCPRPDRMLVKAGDHVDRSTHHCRQRFGSCSQIGDVHRKALVFEVAKLVRQGEWEIDELRLSADSHLNGRLLLWTRTAGGNENQYEEAKQTLVH